MMPVVSRRTAMRRALTHRYFIYALIDTRDGAARYIGRTRNPKTRLYAHLHDSNPRGLRDWFEERREARCSVDFPIELRVLEEVSGAVAALDGEERWIQRARNLGWPIVNVRNCRGGSLGLGRVAGGGEWTLRALGLEAA